MERRRTCLGRFAGSFGRSLFLCTLLLLLSSEAIAAATTVREPAFGLPHFYADTDAELARENGREIAKDRLGQLILLARVGRGTLYQAFGLLDPGTLNDDIEARQTAYTSSELNNMWAKLPARERDLILEYTNGVNDTIDAVYAGSLPEPIEVTVLKTLGLGNDLFGNATNISDQVDPNYLAPGGADPTHPNGGFQFTVEMAIAIGVLEVRTFGLESFGEVSRLSELQALIAKHGTSAGTEIWDDRNFLNDPLAPISVPDPTTPGFGGPLASRIDRLQQLIKLAARYPRYDWPSAIRRHKAAHAHREEFARTWGAWPAMGSYSWIIAGGKSGSGYPWIGGFPQTGIQTPSIMHFAENRSAEGPDPLRGIGMEFAGAPIVLIGQTDTVAWTSTTAQLRVIDTFLEQIIGEDNDNVRYDDEGSPLALNQRTEVFKGITPASRVMWRSHERGGNNGSRSITDFFGDASGTAESGSATELVDDDASFSGSFVGGHVLIHDGTGAGQIREISGVPSGTTLEVGTSWTTAPDATSVYVAVESGNTITAAAVDSPAWQEESTTVVGFAQFQRATDVLDIRAGTRVMPTTHNFPSADNQAFNSVGTSSGNGNTGYYSSGYSRIRQGAEDPRLPLDGTVASPLVVVSGTVDSSTDTTLTATSGVFVSDLSPEIINYRYLNPTQQGSEFIVAIMSGTGAKQTRRIASNTSDTLTIEFPWGVNPVNGDTFEVYEIVAMPEAVNPSEGYTANWNNKAATADDGDGFGRQHRVAFILERLAAENAWDRDKQRQLNKDVAGLDGKGAFSRFLVPRLRDAVDAVGNGGNPDVDTVLAALEAYNGTPEFGREFIDPVSATRFAGESQFLESLINQLSSDIYGDEYSGAISVPGGTDGLNLVQHAIDSAAGDVTGSYMQAYSGDYFNGGGWETVVRDSLSALASGGIPDDSARGACEGGPDIYERCKVDDDCEDDPDDLKCDPFDTGDKCDCVGNSTYNHPLAGLLSKLSFEPTPAGNRGTYEQIVDVGPVVNGEMIFPLGQSGHYEGSLAAVTGLDPNVDTLQPIWRDWRFVPMLHVGEDLESGGSADGDGDGVWDAFERWYFDDTNGKATDDIDGDKADLLAEFLAGTDPTDPDTDDDGIIDGRDTLGQDRLRSGPLKLKGKISLKGGGNDRLSVKAKIGSSDQFDPATQEITATVRKPGTTIYTVTIPAGTLVPNSSGRVFKYKDNTGSLNDLQQALLKVSGSPTGKGSFKIKTIKTDFSAVALVEQELTVEIQIGNHTIPDTRIWEVKGSNLKSTK